MELKSGDILRKGSKFYRVHDFARRSKDVVCNQVLYNPKKKSLVIAQDYTWISLDDIGNVYSVVEEQNKIQELEIIKRKYKLDQINKNLEDIDGNSE